jgi:hypothetical protein
MEGLSVKMRYILLYFFYFTVFKCSFPQTFKWAKNGSDDFANKITCDYTGNLITSNDKSISKWDAAGNFIWQVSVPAYYVKDIVCDKADNIYAAGVFRDTLKIGGLSVISDPQVNNMYLVKINSVGTPLWISRSHSNDFSGADALTIDPQGNPIVVGRFMDNIILDTFHFAKPLTSQIFLAKYSPSGNVIWAKHAKSESFSGGITGPKIKTDRYNNIFIGGHFLWNADFDSIHITDHQPQGQDIFLAKCDPNGSFQWAQSLGGAWQELFGTFDVDSAGNAYVTGYFSSKPAHFGTYTLTTNSYDYFTARFNTNGVCQWAHLGGEEIITAVNDGYYTNLPGFINKYDTLGNLLWSKNVTGTGKIANYAMTATNDAVYVTGSDTGKISFDSHTITSYNWSMFLAKLNVPSSPTVVQSYFDSNDFIVYPNPTNYSITVSVRNISGSCQLRIRNTLGQQVHSETLPPPYTKEIHLNTLAPGVYFVELFTQEKSITRKIVVD